MIGNLISLLFKSEFLRYFSVSLCALLIDLGGFSFFLRVVGINWAMAATCGFVIGSISAYAMSLRFVFRSRVMERTPVVEFVSFVAIGLFGLVLTQLMLWLGIEILKANAELSKLGAAGMTFVSNYILRKFFLFHQRKQRHLLFCQSQPKNIS